MAIALWLMRPISRAKKEAPVGNACPSAGETNAKLKNSATAQSAFCYPTFAEDIRRGKGDSKPPRGNNGNLYDLSERNGGWLRHDLCGQYFNQIPGRKAP